MSGKPPDPRLNAVRGDLAAAALRGEVAAACYVEGHPAQLTAASAPLRREPRFDAPLDSEALRGESVTVYDESEGWAWVQLARDNYVGYMPGEALTRDTVPITHRVSALRAHVYPAPDIKAPPLDLLSLNAGLAVEGEQDAFLRIAGGGFVFSKHAAAIAEHESDFVGVAQRFIGTPYLWGGRTSLGLDCSALVQLSLEACGIAAPRDSDMQEAALGEALADPDDLAQVKRGDLFFWPGHVAIAGDGRTLLHANAFHMACIAEPLAAAIERITASAGPVRAIRRLS